MISERKRKKDVHKQERKHKKEEKEYVKKHHKTAGQKATTQKDSEITSTKERNRLEKHPISEDFKCSMSSVPLWPKVCLYHLAFLALYRKLRKQCDVITGEVEIREPRHAA